MLYSYIFFTSKSNPISDLTILCSKIFKSMYLSTIKSNTFTIRETSCRHTSVYIMGKSAVLGDDCDSHCSDDAGLW